MADLTNIIPISEANLETLKNGGTVSKGGQTYSYDQDALYLSDTISADQVANGANKFFVENFVDNGSTVTMTINGVTFTLAKVQ